MQRIAVLGAGSWGTALAVHLCGVGHDVRLWGRDEQLVRRLRESRVNRAYLPGVEIPTGVVATSALSEALEAATLVVVAVPSHGLRSVVRAAAGVLPEGVTLVSATKGLEVDPVTRMSEVCEQELGPSAPVVVLSGPSFALELAHRLPTAVLVASRTASALEVVQREFRAASLRLYASDDVVGVEIGGALKNVIAIAAGVVEALGLGQNALAALITRGLAEISRLACAAGGRRDTLAGLSGLGDLILTCTGSLSRNRQVGLELGRGRQLAEILEGMLMVAEGIRTTDAALVLGSKYGIELPIAAQMADVLAGRQSPRSAVEALMLRRQRAEADRA